MKDNPEITIRELALSELTVAENIARRVWPSAYRNVITPEQIEYMLQWMYSLETMTQEVTEQNIRYDLLEVNNTPTGFSAFGPLDEKTIKLHKLYILPEFQHHGLGSRLLQHIVDTSAQAGFQEIVLNVNKKNTQAINAYIKFGFKKKGKTIDNIGHGFVMDDYIMAFNLPA
jgi:diamine N-acetyltransferase